MVECEGASSPLALNRQGRANATKGLCSFAEIRTHLSAFYPCRIQNLPIQIALLLVERPTYDTLS